MFECIFCFRFISQDSESDISESSEDFRGQQTQTTTSSHTTVKKEVDSLILDLQTGQTIQDILDELNQFQNGGKENLPTKRKSYKPKHISSRIFGHFTESSESKTRRPEQMDTILKELKQQNDEVATLSQRPRTIPPINSINSSLYSTTEDEDNSDAELEKKEKGQKTKHTSLKSERSLKNEPISSGTSSNYTPPPIASVPSLTINNPSNSLSPTKLVRPQRKSKNNNNNNNAPSAYNKGTWRELFNKTSQPQEEKSSQVEEQPKTETKEKKKSSLHLKPEESKTHNEMEMVPLEETSSDREFEASDKEKDHHSPLLSRKNRTTSTPQTNHSFENSISSNNSNFPTTTTPVSPTNTNLKVPVISSSVSSTNSSDLKATSSSASSNPPLNSLEEKQKMVKDKLLEQIETLLLPNLYRLQREFECKEKPEEIAFYGKIVITLRRV